MTKSKKQPKPAAMSPEEFRAILDARGLTQGQAADLLKYTRTSVNFWATGRQRITESVANHIRTVLTGRAR